MTRGVIAFAVIMALLAGVVPAAAIPPACADCCHEFVIQAPAAALPDCCGLAPADSRVALKSETMAMAAPVTLTPLASQHASATPVRIASLVRPDARRACAFVLRL